MTLGKIREIAVLKLIGTRNSTIAGMILQQAPLIGFVEGQLSATMWVMLVGAVDAMRAFAIVGLYGPKLIKAVGSGITELDQMRAILHRDGGGDHRHRGLKDAAGAPRARARGGGWACSVR